MTHLLRPCEDREPWDVEHTCSYIRSNIMVKNTVISATSIDDVEEPAPTYEDIQ